MMNRMKRLEELLSISSEPLASKPSAFPEFLRAYVLGPELFEMLKQKNGFYAFESSLHVLPLTSDSESGLEGWNRESLWRTGYQDLADGLLFFAEDILQDQFCLSTKKNSVLRFHAETGRIDFAANSLEEWADLVLSNFQEETGWTFAHEWQLKNGPLPQGQRLMPKKPFFLGGGYELGNLWAGDALEGMRFKADLAMQTRELPEGAQVKINLAPKPE
jgi:hypothetical protein